MTEWIHSLPHWVVTSAIVAFFCLVGCLIYACLSYDDEDWFP